MSIGTDLFKKVMSHWGTGISVVTTAHEGEWQGFTVNSFASVSIDPLLISLSVTKSLYAGQLIGQSGIFAVNILTRDQVEWGKLFAGFYPEREDRFAGIQCTLAQNGAPILPGVLGWLSCNVHQQIDVGASNLLLGEVVEGHIDESAGEPLLYYHRQWGRFVPDAE